MALKTNEQVPGSRMFIFVPILFGCKAAVLILDSPRWQANVSHTLCMMSRPASVNNLHVWIKL